MNRPEEVIVSFGELEHQTRGQWYMGVFSRGVRIGSIKKHADEFDQHSLRATRYEALVWLPEAGRLHKVFPVTDETPAHSALANARRWVSDRVNDESPTLAALVADDIVMFWRRKIARPTYTREQRRGIARNVLREQYPALEPDVERAAIDIIDAAVFKGMAL